MTRPLARILSTSLALALVATACDTPAAPPELPGEVIERSEPPSGVVPGSPGLSMTTADWVTTPDGRFSVEIEVRLLAGGPDGAVPVVGEAVTFRVTKGHGTLSATEVDTDADGNARTTITFGLADENVIESFTATEQRATTTVHAYCAAAPEQTTLPCPGGN